MRFLKSKPRRSLYRLRLKFEETTRVVCTDYSWSLQKVLRTYKFNCVYSLKYLRVSIIVSVRTYNWHLTRMNVGALQNAVIARHWDWRRREFTLVNDGAWMPIITQRVPHYAMVSKYQFVSSLRSGTNWKPSTWTDLRSSGFVRRPFTIARTIAPRAILQ